LKTKKIKEKRDVQMTSSNMLLASDAVGGDIQGEYMDLKEMK
jgi:hypothetical protein